MSDSGYIKTAKLSSNGMRIDLAKPAWPLTDAEIDAKIAAKYPPPTARDQEIDKEISKLKKKIRSLTVLFIYFSLFFNFQINSSSFEYKYVIYALVISFVIDWII